MTTTVWNRLLWQLLLLLLCLPVKAQHTWGNDSLKAVTVISRKPLISRKADRFVINVAESFLANGHSGLEVLQHAPGIWVDAKGTIRLQGNKPVTVMLNDQLLRMSADELADYLRSIKSEDISSIEVITNPPAEYEAGAGGIIRIILKKPVANGVKGYLNAQYRQQASQPYATPGGAIDYKKGNWYLQGSYSHIIDRKKLTEEARIIYKGKRDYRNYTDRAENVHRNLYRFGLAYDINTKHTLSVQTTVSGAGTEQLFLTTSTEQMPGVITTGTVAANRQRTITFHSTTLQYAWKMDTVGSALKLSTDATGNRREEYAGFIEQYSNAMLNNTYYNDVKAITDIYTIQADYNKILPDKTELKTGARFAAIRRKNELRFSSTGDNRFNYHENLGMLYCTIHKSFGSLSIKAGMRIEQTWSHGNAENIGVHFSRKYIGFFPSLFFTRRINNKENNAFFLSYARKLTRPSLSDLNPNRLQFNNYTAVTGNPRLNPQYTHNLELGYNFGTSASLSSYASFTNNAISLLADTGRNNFIEYYSVNFRNNTEYGLSLNLPLKITNWWKVENSFAGYHVSFSNQHLISRQISFAAKSVHTASLGKENDLDLVADYRSPTAYSNLRMPHQFYLDLGFTKKLWDNLVRLRLSGTDLLNTVREKEITDDNAVFIDFYRKRPSRTAAITITWNFSSGKKFNNRKIEQAGNEERNRIGN